MSSITEIILYLFLGGAQVGEQRGDVREILSRENIKILHSILHLALVEFFNYFIERDCRLQLWTL